MVVPTNTVQTYAQVGRREDLADFIDMLDKDETPFYSMIKKPRVSSTSPEWQKDDLPAASGANTTIEGDDVTADTANQPEKLRNYTQLSDKVAQVSSTAQSVNTAGRSNDLLRELAVKGRALRTDIETRICGNYASVAGAAGTARETAGAEAWIETNVDLGTGGTPAGAVGGFNSGTNVVDAATDNSTQRAITETMLKTVIRSAWTNGGKPSTVLVGPFNKQAISAFSGIATQYRENSGKTQATILAAAAIYVSDFGEHKIVPSRFTRDRTALVLDPSRWELGVLQPMKQEPLAKTGHSDKRMISMEYALVCRNEKASGKVADLTTS
jgi:hypothetical protein